MPGLTKKQEAFALAFVKLGNASDAYRATYTTSKSTAKTVHESASRLAADPKVAARIAQLRGRALEKAGMDAERTLQEIASVASQTPEDPVKYSDKLSALALLAKHHGLFEKDNKQRGENLAVTVKLL